MAGVLLIPSTPDVSRRATVIQLWHATHQAVERESRQRLRLWRSDYEDELRRLHIRKRPDAVKTQRPVNLSDPSFFFSSLRDVWDEAFQGLGDAPRGAISRLQSIRNDAAHGVKLGDRAVAEAYNASDLILTAFGAAPFERASFATGTVGDYVMTSSVPLSPDWPPQHVPIPPRTTAAPPAQVTARPSLPTTHQVPTVEHIRLVPALNHDGATTVDETSQPTVLPIYLLCDISDSMLGDGIQAVNSGLADLTRTLLADPMAAEKCHVSVITFASHASVARPLSPISAADNVLQLVPNGLTNYGKAFGLTRTTIDKDVARLRAQNYLLRPVVYVLTDGAPTDEGWSASFDQLVDPRGEFAPSVVFIPVAPIDPIIVDRLKAGASGYPLNIIDTSGIGAIGKAVRSAILRVTASVIATVTSPNDELTLPEAVA